MPPRPTPEELLQALDALQVVAAYLAASSGASAETYNQRDLPPGARSRDAYLRLHRARVKARVPGWSILGKQRLVAAAAWAAEIERETAHVALSPTKPKLVGLAGGSGGRDVDDELDRQLGIRSRRATR